MKDSEQSQPAADPDTTGDAAVLDPAYVEAVARRVVELIRDESRQTVGRRLVDAATLAAELGVERSWVYEHRDELAPVRLGTGLKPRLRFDVQAVSSVLAARSFGQWHAGDITDTGSSALPRRRSQRPNAKSTVGGVLTVRPRGAR
jgi:hypothetical protein